MLNAGLGVIGAAVYRSPCGVVIIEVPRAEGFDGGVDGGFIPERFGHAFAGDGELAKSRRRRTPSPVGLLLRCLSDRLRVGGGVRGPVALKLYASRLNECP
jgi:hypothetical protein